MSRHGSLPNMAGMMRHYDAALMYTVLGLDAVFRLTGRGPFTWFFWLFHLGVLVTSVMMAVRGVLTVDGLTPAETSAAIPGIAGLGHMLVTAGLALLFVALYSGVRERQARLETGRAGGAAVEGA
ncbi:DUF2871 family protein [Micrococcus luteus]|uniref:DUF2871 family protein n=2 Tax=Micrococcus luteus TaxID=1270 RepID=UPI0019D0C67E|nr:DUF2871 family protein [Micrococcus luteus]MBN6750081.1 DUF2871 family protein [Micrococcus luteus]MBN6759973.1 DUF2871 family protein [Micrococcus luteus]MBN6801688.1 DUF2871 family protein [Micrococcus luteus]